MLRGTKHSATKRGNMDAVNWLRFGLLLTFGKLKKYYKKKKNAYSLLLLSIQYCLQALFSLFFDERVST